MRHDAFIFDTGMFKGCKGLYIDNVFYVALRDICNIILFLSTKSVSYYIKKFGLEATTFPCKGISGKHPYFIRYEDGIDFVDRYLGN